MIAAPPSTVELVWDLTAERPTIGGALVLRQEGEILARLQGESTATLHLVCGQEERFAAEQLAATVFGSSACQFQLIRSTSATTGWPQAAQRSRSGFSYFSFTRLLDLYRDNGVAPRLRWNAAQATLACQARARFTGRLTCVHLRSVPPYSAQESNADGPAWNEFFARHAQPEANHFLLIGDDRLPAGLALRPGVTRAADLGLDLATQLALVGCADGFLGLASGLCTAANLSETPHVIFKHPAHHPAEMARELGDADRFPFAGPRQRLWRRVADADALDEAFDLICP